MNVTDDKHWEERFAIPSASLSLPADAFVVGLLAAALADSLLRAILHIRDWVHVAIQLSVGTLLTLLLWAPSIFVGALLFWAVCAAAKIRLRSRTAFATAGSVLAFAAQFVIVISGIFAPSDRPTTAIERIHLFQGSLVTAAASGVVAGLVFRERV
jgi:hypothetical protein